MIAAMKHCAATGCSTLLPPGQTHCPAHARAMDARRGTAQERGYGSRWAAYSRAWRRQHPLCGDRLDGPSSEHSRCVADGRTTAATQVDHIRAVNGPADPLFWEPTNHQSLCRDCHSRKTALENGRWG
ncbi:MAG: HNH endonuclease [Betaproteobacteria bacterium]|nr:HNH endonuclease [Betaproteobacteria bacterium]